MVFHRCFIDLYNNSMNLYINEWFSIIRIVCYLHRSTKFVFILEGAGSVNVFLKCHEIYESIYKTIVVHSVFLDLFKIYESIHK